MPERIDSIARALVYKGLVVAGRRHLANTERRLLILRMGHR